MTSRNRSLAARVVLTMAAVVTLGGCATKGDLRDLQIELRTLAARQDSVLTELRMQALSTQDTLRTQSDQIFDFRGEITRQLRDISESLTRLEAIAGANQRGLANVRDRLDNMGQRATQPQVTLGDSSAVAGGVGGGDPRQMYNAAMRVYQQGSLATAQMAFEQFVGTYANHELVDDAYFYLADILEQQDDLEGALAGFREIQTRFPTADKVPDAMYRVALIQIEQEDTDAAIDTLQRIINTYTGTDIAAIAQDKLDEIRG